MQALVKARLKLIPSAYPYEEIPPAALRHDAPRLEVALLGLEVTRRAVAERHRAAQRGRCRQRLESALAP